jgi:hypothetical protein
MKISEYLLQEFQTRLSAKSVLVVYDAERRYESIFDQLESTECRAIKATESTIQSRLDAEASLRELAKATPSYRNLAIYVPRPSPEFDDPEARQLEPFAYFSSIGQQFPMGDGDSYKSLCRKAKPAHVVEIDKLFDQGSEPDFATVDAVDASGGLSWPRLRSTLKADSAQDIVIKFLAANAELRKELDTSEDWVPEIDDFLQRTFNLKLVTRGKKWRSITDEIWRFMLFSEFTFDLPIELPASLEQVPVAGSNTRELIFEICDRLRNNRQTQSLYLEQAKQIDNDLELEQSVKGIMDYGDRDTFSFEERGFLSQYIEAVLKGTFDTARAIELTHRDSIWVSEGARLQEWRLVGQAFQLSEAIEDFNREHTTPPIQLPGLLKCYQSDLRIIDQLHRALLQAEEDLIDQPPAIAKLLDQITEAYELLIGRYIQAFTNAIQHSGWPPEELPRNRDVFSRFVEPKLQANQKVAYFLIDSLRYDLAVGLQQELEQLHSIDLHPVSAQLPTITPVGMASLMPQADQKFSMLELDDTIVPALGGKPVRNTTERANWIRSIYGDRYMDLKLQEIVKASHKITIPKVVDLLVVRNTEIDMAGETDASFALREIPRTLQKIRVAIQKLSEKGFSNIVIATDHGFHLRTSVRPGYKVEKPEGPWSLEKDRALIGKGTTTEKTQGYKTEDVGIPLSDALYVVPKNLSTFIENTSYFHSGLSLQECVLPVLTIKSIVSRKEDDEITIMLSYKDGKIDKITTQRPLIEVSYVENMFGPEMIQLRLEAKAKDEIVGEAVIGNKNVDPTTGSVNINKGETVKVPLRMNENYEGNFEVVALNPDTLRKYHSIKLKTNYL